MPKVMVVDDEESLLEAIRYALSREGMDVVTARDGGDALRAYPEYSKAVVEDGRYVVRSRPVAMRSTIVQKASDASCCAASRQSLCSPSPGSES